MLMLVFAMAYLVVRNIKEKGLLLDWHDFTCAPLQRDAAESAVIMACAYTASFALPTLMRLWIAQRIGWNALLLGYVWLQILGLVLPITALYLTPIAPLPSAAVSRVRGTYHYYTNTLECCRS
jgi:hypothetical protein